MLEPERTTFQLAIWHHCGVGESPYCSDTAPVLSNITIFSSAAQTSR